MRWMVQTRSCSQVAIANRSRKVASGAYLPEHDLEVVQAQWGAGRGGRGTPVIGVEGPSRVGRILTVSICKLTRRLVLEIQALKGGLGGQQSHARNCNKVTGKE